MDPTNSNKLHLNLSRTDLQSKLDATPEGLTLKSLKRQVEEMRSSVSQSLSNLEGLLNHIEAQKAQFNIQCQTAQRIA